MCKGQAKNVRLMRRLGKQKITSKESNTLYRTYIIVITRINVIFFSNYAPPISVIVSTSFTFPDSA